MKSYLRVTGALLLGAVALPALAELASGLLPLLAALFGSGLMMTWLFGRRYP